MNAQSAWRSAQTEVEYQKLWLAVLNFFQFETLNDEPDLAKRYQPCPRTEFAVYELKSVDAEFNAESEKLIRDYTDALTRAYCRVLGSHDSVIVFDPYHEAGIWNPHGTGSVKSLLAGFTAEGLYPQGDYCMCVIPPAAAGLFGHPWARRVRVCGQRLIDAVEADRPALLGQRV